MHAALAQRGAGSVDGLFRELGPSAAKDVAGAPPAEPHFLFELLLSPGGGSGGGSSGAGGSGGGSGGAAAASADAAAAEPSVTGIIHGPHMSGKEYHVTAFRHAGNPTALEEDPGGPSSNLLIFVAYDDRFYKLTAVSLEAASGSSTPSSPVNKSVDLDPCHWAAWG